MGASVARIFRHPVKGLRPEELAEARLIPGRGVEGDRAFAFQFLDEAVPLELRQAEAESVPWSSKFNMANQHDWPALARIVPRWCETTRRLALVVDGKVEADESTETAEGRSRLARFVQGYLAACTPYEKARHGTASEVRLIGNRDLSSRYTDGSTGPVTLATEATFEDLGQRLGLEMDCRRFRLNLILAGGRPWEELDWVGKRLRVGSCVIEIQKPVGRCANIDVHPESGARDAVIYARLKATFGHALGGVRGEVVQGGVIRPGDAWSLELIES